MTSLREIAKKKIVEQVLNATQNGIKVMVVDKESVKILGSVLKMFEVAAENVALIENIDLDRKKFDFDALYFLSPCEDSISRLMHDFKDKKNPTYPRIHLFFVEPVPDALLRRLADSNAYAFVHTFKELYLDFCSFEAQVFHFGMRHSFYQMFSPRSHESEHLLQCFAAKIVSVCVTLGEVPVIRYCANSPMAAVSEKLARYSQTFFESEIAKGNLQFNPTVPRATLLILDRSFDTVSPLLHEFTYQAMANDLVDIKDGKIFTYKSSASAAKEMLLDESDEIWLKLRHMHIAEVISELISDFNKFMAENKAAAKSVGSKSDEHKDVDIKSLAEMKKILAALPQFQELKAKFSAHMNIAQTCMHRFSSDKLAAAAAQEQNMATGSTADGSEAKNILNDLVPLLTDDSISSNVKARLIMLYFITRKAIDDEEQKKLVHYANLTADDAAAIHNLGLFGLKTTRDKADAKSLKKTKRRFKKHDEDVPYELSRYRPPLRAIVEDACTNGLSNLNFPSLPDPPAILGLCGGAAVGVRSGHGESGSGKLATSLRNKPAWQAKKGAEQKSVSGSRLLFFIAGGMTFSEIRSAFEIEQLMKRDIILGSTHILTPTMFMQDLAQLSRDQFTASPESAKGKHSLAKLKDKKKH